MKKGLFFILCLFLVNTFYSQVTDSKVTIFIGYDEMEAPIPESIEEYHEMLSTIVEMYNDLNLAYNALEGDFNDLAGGMSVYDKSSESLLDNSLETLENMQSDMSKLYFSGVQKERFRQKYGIALFYDFNNLFSHSLSANFIYGNNSYIYTIGPLVNFDFYRGSTSLGLSLGFGYIF